MIKIFRFIARIASFIFCKTFFRIKFYGQKNVPLKQGCVIAPNHTTYFDPVFVGSGLPFFIAYMARDTLFKNKFFGFLLRWCNTIPIRRVGSLDRRAMAEACDRLKSGECVLMFPEGTRSKDGSFGKGNPGLGFLAIQAQAPIIPVYIDGGYKVWPKGSKRIRFVKIQVFYGKPIFPDQILKNKENCSEKEKCQMVVDAVMEKIAELKK